MLRPCSHMPLACNPVSLVMMQNVTVAEGELPLHSVVYAEYLVCRRDGFGFGRLRILHSHLKVQRVSALAQ